LEFSECMTQNLQSATKRYSFKLRYGEPGFNVMMLRIFLKKNMVKLIMADSLQNSAVNATR
jgi:hypothetical protein